MRSTEKGSELQVCTPIVRGTQSVRGSPSASGPDARSGRLFGVITCSGNAEGFASPVS
jgi:hypothetical protein